MHLDRTAFVQIGCAKSPFPYYATPHNHSQRVLLDFTRQKAQQQCKAHMPRRPRHIQVGKCPQVGQYNNNCPHARQPGCMHAFSVLAAPEPPRQCLTSQTIQIACDASLTAPAACQTHLYRSTKASQISTSIKATSSTRCASCQGRCAQECQTVQGFSP